MSEVNETKLEHTETTLEHTETTLEHRDVIAIKLEEIKEPTPIKQEKETDDIDIIEPVKTVNKIELKPENVLIDGVEHLYSYMKNVHHEKITAVNIVIVTTELMQIVEKYKGLTGPQKKMLVINVIKKVVNSQVDSSETRSTLNTVIDFTLPVVIDNLIDAINGNMKFDKEKVKSFFKKYICCCINKS
jgi:hypothetical protein